MKTRSKIIMGMMTLSFLMAGCHGSKNESAPNATDSVAVERPDTLTAEEKAAFDKDVKEFLIDMYNRQLFQEDTFLNIHCSEAIIQKMKDEYAKKYKADGLAYWIFRSDKDGDGDVYSLVSVRPEDDFWYKYTFYDNGIAGAHRVKVIKTDTIFHIEEIE